MTNGSDPTSTVAGAWIFGGIVALAGAAFACKAGYESTSMWAEEWPPDVRRYAVFFGLNALVAVFGAFPGVVLGLILAPAGKAIILACALAGPSAYVFGFVGGFRAGLDGTFSVLTLPNWSIMGACFGASAGGLIALLCGCHLQRGFRCLFGAALGSMVCMILSVTFFSTSGDAQQLLKDAIALSFIFLGVLGGAAVQFMTKFNRVKT
jgi:hypothetical protein